MKNSKCLKAHQVIKHGEKSVEDDGDSPVHTCHLCNKQYRSEKYLDNHLKKHEKRKDKPSEFPCEICKRNFVNVQRLRKHIESIHENLYPHVCDTCGKKFKNKASFERHVLEHQGIIEPPVQCAVCGEWRKNTHTLRLHMFTHQREDVYCSVCNKKCVSKTALRGHMRYAHRKQKNLNCKFCEKVFKDKRNLDVR